jgi:UDP-N-acetylmuramate: L-alanyl-gamma-D-glutamyl-meso-diaminopimelate ligase
MKMGIHQSVLGQACASADFTFWYDAGTLGLDLASVAASSPSPARVVDSIESLITALLLELRAGDDVVIMSNGGFGGIHQKLLQALRTQSGWELKQ